jgi:hypothetical protein
MKKQDLKNKFLTVRVSSEELEQIYDDAKKHERSASSFILWVYHEWRKRFRPKKKK